MAIRFYIVPIEQVGNARGPEYFHWRFDQNPVAGLEGIRWSLKDYGSINVGIVAADVTTAQHNILAVQSDVTAIPANLDATIGGGNLTAVRNALEGLRIPGAWVQANNSYRTVVRTVTGLFLYAQRVTALAGGQPLLRLNDNLNTQFQDLPADIRAAMQQAAEEFGYDTSGLTATSTLRQILKQFADDWGETPIEFGLTTL